MYLIVTNVICQKYRYKFQLNESSMNTHPPAKI
jgi:hypothetical protein